MGSRPYLSPEHQSDLFLLLSMNPDLANSTFITRSFRRLIQTGFNVGLSMESRLHLLSLCQATDWSLEERTLLAIPFFKHFLGSEQNLTARTARNLMYLPLIQKFVQRAH